MRRSRALTPLEALERFSARAESVDYAPTINRYVPMPHQELFHKDQHRNRIVGGGNRGGKTYSTIADDVWCLLRKHPWRNHFYPETGPLRFRFVGVDFERGIDQTAVPLFAQFIPPSALVNGSWEDSYRGKGAGYMLTLADGSTVSFMSYEQKPGQFQSVRLHHIHFDEEPPKPIWDESMKRLLDFGGTWTLSETPVLQLEWVFDELIEPALSGQRTDIGYELLDSRENIHLDPELLREQLAGMSEREVMIRVTGQYDRAGTFVFPTYIAGHPYVVPFGQFVDAFRRNPREWVIDVSMDYGYANPTAWLWHAISSRGDIVTFDMLYSPRVVVAEWVQRVKAKNTELAGILGLPEGWEPRMYVGDPAIKQDNQGSTGISIQQEYAMAGIPIGVEGIVKARSGNQNIGLDKIRTYLLPRPEEAGPSAIDGMVRAPWWRMTDRTLDLQKELKMARRPKQSLAHAEEKNPSEDIRDKDNHAIDAAKYEFVITHDLRPAEFARDQDRTFADFVADQYHPARTSQRIDTDLDATLLSGTRWAISGSSYSDLEA
jgi:phage terminase large subunit-like protein